MLNLVIDKINEQSKEFERYSNEWNIANQLIDILTVQPDQAEIVLQDLDIEDLSIFALVDKITSQRISNPEEVMKTICDFYSIKTPQELPPEVWRNKATKELPKTKADVSLFDLL